MTSDASTGRWDHASERVLRELTPKVIGILGRRYRDFHSVEDAVQEALLSASRQWPRDGTPDSPCAWLIQVATRRLIDVARTEIARRQRENVITADEEPQVEPFEDIDAQIDPEDTLNLLFMCCHPSLSPASSIALTLRAVGGLTTAEIANAFLVPESTMAQRIARAKQTIRESGVSFQTPTPQQREPRLPAVLHVLYLIFSEGYASSSGTQLQRLDLACEAIRLTRDLCSLLPEHPETAGLLALMLLTHARSAARASASGELIPLDQQDRSLWSRDEIAEGVALLTLALSKGSVGRYQLQAAIAAVHDEAVQPENTNWSQILALYELLLRMDPGPMVTLNHAIAVAMVHGPQKGLDKLQVLDGNTHFHEHFRLDAVRAHLFEKLGRLDQAIEHYRTAAAGATSLPEQNFLIAQAARLQESLHTQRIEVSGGLPL